MLETPKALNPDVPAHLDFLHRKILYALDERPVFWWKRGTKYGVISGEITPMWDMWVFFVQRVVEHREESFDVASLEAVYLTDHDTGALLETYTNPYTGETLALPGRLMGPETQTFDSDVWLSVDSSAIVTRASDARPFRVNDLETFNAKRSDVLDPDQSCAPAQATLHLISSWQGWLNMGDRLGSQVTRLVAKKAFDFRGVAPELQSLLGYIHPDIAADPVAALERPQESFEH